MVPTGRPRARAVGQTLPPGFGGQVSLRAAFARAAMQPGHGNYMAAAMGAALVPATAPEQGQTFVCGPAGAQPLPHQYPGMGQHCIPMMYPHGPPQDQSWRACHTVYQSPQGVAYQGCQQVLAPQPPHVQHQPHATAPVLHQGQVSQGAPPPTQDTAGEAMNGNGNTIRAYPDDKQNLSSSYRFVGNVWLHGVRAVIPKKFKGGVLTMIDEDTWTPFRLALLDEVQTDCLFYIVTGVPPGSRLADLQCKTKGDLRKAFVKEARRLSRCEPQRLKRLSHYLRNIVGEAVRLGYGVENLPQNVRTEVGIVIAGSPASSNASATTAQPPPTLPAGPQRGAKRKHEDAETPACPPTGKGDRGDPSGAAQATLDMPGCFDVVETEKQQDNPGHDDEEQSPGISTAEPVQLGAPATFSEMEEADKNMIRQTMAKYKISG